LAQHGCQHECEKYAVILEVAILDVRPGEASKFEAAFAEAQSIIASMKGYLGHQLQRCMERPNRYILLVNWQTLEDHTIGFRRSDEYQQWRALLHHFYEPFPAVEHYEHVFGKGTNEGD
jgi:heme-degrading monooxygenase HmoA